MSSTSFFVFLVISFSYFFAILFFSLLIPLLSLLFPLIYSLYVSVAFCSYSLCTTGIFLAKYS